MLRCIGALAKTAGESRSEYIAHLALQVDTDDEIKLLCNMYGVVQMKIYY